MLRNKKRFAVITLIALLAGSAIWYVATVSRKETVYGTSAEVAIGKAVAALNKDSDADGLKDWEEELWNTAITKEDTDNDGTKDGEEIRQGRNPLMAGPDDALDPETLHTKVNEARPEDETRTAAFSRAFFSRYLELRRQSGGALPPDALETLISGAVADASKTAPAKEYNKDDIKEDGAGPEALRAYGNRLGLAILESTPEDPEDIAQVFRLASAETEAANQEAELERLVPQIEGYQAVIERMLAMPVPPEARESHLGILNAFEEAREGLSGIRNMVRDPINALPSITLFQKGGADLETAFRLLKAEFLKARIRFAPDESGYLIEQLSV